MISISTTEGRDCSITAPLRNASEQAIENRELSIAFR